MSTGWDLASDSPLLPFVDGATRRAAFSVTPAPRSPLPHVAGLLAGAAEVDLTPPPGMPKAGYSANAHTSRGFRTRLRARVIHLRSGDASLLLVQCDLLGGSSIVQHLVARAIADRTDVPLAGVFIGATHTHAGPGQFLGTDFYNRFASNKSGFDPAYTQFLVAQIASAAQRAVDERRPATLAFGEREVWGLTRNRSLDPHVRNETVADKRTEPQRKFLAANPTMHLLRVDATATDGGREPLAAMVVFSVHGTGVSVHDDEYNADVWAYLVGELGHLIQRVHGTRPVVGAIEGTHADVAPAIRPGLAGHLEAARVGRGLGREAAELYEALEPRLHGDVQLGCGLREVDLSAHRSIDGIDLPRRPAVGAALVAGAHENLTPGISKVGPFRPGHGRKRATGPQAEKWVIGSRWLQPLILPLNGFPRVIPVQVLRIGDHAIVGLPFELTVETGRRIREAANATLAGSGIDRVVVSSVANEYSGYVTTPEEYRRQHYEGGHTLYGPRTQPFLTAHVARLAGEVARAGIVSDVLPTRSWSLHVERYLADDRPAGVPRHVVGRPGFHDPTRTADGFWELRWADEAPGVLHWHEPLVHVEACDRDDDWEPAQSDGRLVDDQGWAIEVRHAGRVEHAHHYLARWWDPAFRGGRRHRFVLAANGGRPQLASDPFD